jgi:diguanylate cyclase (GGDEF)-like protein/PAS domain S-box-containing protein
VHSGLKLRRSRRLYAAAVVVLVAVLAQLAGLLNPLDRWLGDMRFRAGIRDPSGTIAIVDIDARSLQEIGTWPWPRQIHASLIDNLVTLGAAEIAFDVDFSTTSNAVDDAALAAALERAGGTVILASFAQAASSHPGETAVVYNVPIPQFLANAWTATVNVTPDGDGAVRKVSNGGTIAGTPTQSLSATLAGYAAPPYGEYPVDFSIRADKVDRIPAIDILRGDVDKSRVAGKKMVIGASAVELRDLFQVPADGVVSGTLLQVLGAETLLQGRVLEGGGAPLRYGVLLLIAIPIAFALRRVRWTILLGALAALAVGIEAAATFLQVRGILHVDTAMWQISLVGFAVVAVGGEIDFRRILLLISRTETRNVRTILDQVIADNFAGVIVVGADGAIRSASRSAARILGLGTRAIEGERVDDIAPPALAEAAHAVLGSGDAAAEEPRELRWTRADGAARILEYVVTPSQLAGGVSVEGHALPDRVVATLTFVDVTERRRAEERVAYLARFDALTGLPNRNRFEEKLEEALVRYRASGECCAVLFFDLDRFKGVNDTLGHDYGDRLLTAVARRLQEVVGSRPGGDIVARFGGDEYAVLMSGPVTAEEAGALAERLIAIVSEPFDLDQYRLIVGLSVGIAIPRSAEAVAGTLMKNADAALYRAKSAGGNGYRLFDASFETAIRARREIEVELWDAFDRGEFEVFYQPQVALSDRSITGVEALVRWRHPERGYVSPAEFVPVAEAVGLIAPLGLWVLERACRDVAQWPVPIKVAVNLSPVQFVKGDLAGSVEAALAGSGLPAERLGLEITESLFLQENGVIAETIGRLHAKGVSFIIDDFGTGYSSFAYVSKFPVAKIKIDQSFVRGLPHDSESTAIVRAVCTLAKGLSITANAEGIETEEQAVALRLFGCDEGQGYLFGKPRPAARIVEMLEAQAGMRRRTA